MPWHSSRFELHTGDVTRGPASVPQPRYEVREADGVLRSGALSSGPCGAIRCQKAPRSSRSA